LRHHWQRAGGKLALHKAPAIANLCCWRGGQQQDVRRGGGSDRATVGSVLAIFLVVWARPVGALGEAMQLYMHVHMDENFKEAKEQKILRRLTFFS
jgi:hypothetical protein